MSARPAPHDSRFGYVDLAPLALAHLAPPGSHAAAGTEPGAAAEPCGATPFPALHAGTSPGPSHRRRRYRHCSAAAGVAARELAAPRRATGAAGALRQAPVRMQRAGAMAPRCSRHLQRRRRRRCQHQWQGPRAGWHQLDSTPRAQAGERSGGGDRGSQGEAGGPGGRARRKVARARPHRQTARHRRLAPSSGGAGGQARAGRPREDATHRRSAARQGRGAAGVPRRGGGVGF